MAEKIKLKFIIDEKKDYYVWLSFFRNSNTFGEDNYKDNKKIFELMKKTHYFPEIFPIIKNKYYTKKQVNRFNVDFKKEIIINMPTIIKQLEEIHKKPFPKKIKSVHFYFTSFSRSPYNIKENLFYMFVNRTILPNKKEYVELVNHELMHLFFHYYFEKKFIKKKISKEDINDIKEALTILINDKGYEKHKTLRKEILKEWKKQKDFNKLIDFLLDKFAI